MNKHLRIQRAQTPFPPPLSLLYPPKQTQKRLLYLTLPLRLQSLLHHLLIVSQLKEAIFTLERNVDFGPLETRRHVVEYAEGVVEHEGEGREAD